MRILLLAPQPFFAERGTPIAVRALAAALCNLGHEVDLLVLHEGKDIAMPGLRIVRAWRPPFVQRVPIGLSLVKLACDLSLALMAWRLIGTQRYDVLHAVEEAVYPALLAGLLKQTPVVYDMDSLLVDQVLEKWPRFAGLRPLLNILENWPLRRADLVLAVCPTIADQVRDRAPKQSVFLLPDIAEPMPVTPPPDGLWNLRKLAEGNRCVALYVGNLETYQGVDLLIAAMGQLPSTDACRLIVIGGNEAAIAAAKAFARGQGAQDRVILTGPAPLEHLPWLLRQADILCSPRARGANTPMKIYSYMAAGRPLLATRITSHTQILDDHSAMLVEPAVAALATGLSTLIRDPTLRHRLGSAAARLAKDRYGPDSFATRVQTAYASLATRCYPLREGMAQR